MRRAPLFATAVLAAAAAALAGGAAAQTVAGSPGQTAGLRYLSWTSRPAVDPARVAAPAGNAGSASSRRPNRVIPHGGVAASSSPAVASPAPRRTLTPATAWMRPVTPPPAPAPTPVAPAAPTPAPAPAPRAVAPARTVPDYLPDQGGQMAPAEAVAPAVVAPTSTDPMAPRRDAPIFRMQRTDATPAVPESAPAASDEAAPAAARAPAAPARVALVTANPADHPTLQGARYYSVHRQAGREPDPLTLPQPTYVDALAVTMTETPASQDLAQPAEPPAMIRDAQGRLRASPAASDGDHQ